MFVDQDTSLTLEQKKRRLDELRAKLPPEQQSLVPQPAS
jgi:lipase chaperone LimK